MKINIHWQAAKEVFYIFSTIFGWLFFALERKENKRLKEEKKKLDVIDTEEQFSLLKIEEEKLKKEYEKQREQKNEEMATRGLTHSGIRIKELDALKADKELSLKGIEAKRKKLEELKSLQK